jgi:hypothetical protein
MEVGPLCDSAAHGQACYHRNTPLLFVSWAVSNLSWQVAGPPYGAIFLVASGGSVIKNVPAALGTCSIAATAVNIFERVPMAVGT